MIGLLDPALFLPRPAQEVSEDLASVLRICKEHRVCLATLEEYWKDLWSNLAQPLERALPADAKRALQEVRKYGESSNRFIAPLSHAPGSVWRRGFQQLFGGAIFASSWEERMAAAAIRAVASGEEVVVFTRRMEGRNLSRHQAGNVTLNENTRWVLHLQPSGLGHRQVLCVHHRRNLVDRWTSRFDYRLPGHAPGVPYPFCPPEYWWKGATPAHRTVQSRPAWIDRLDNGWARPNINGGAGYHWDVYVATLGRQVAVGLDQINVVQFGAPEAEGSPGHLHHEPTGKAGMVTGTGWTC